MGLVCTDIDCVLEKRVETIFFLLLWNLPDTEVVERHSLEAAGVKLSRALVKYWFPGSELAQLLCSLSSCTSILGHDLSLMYGSQTWPPLQRTDLGHGFPSGV